MIKKPKVTVGMIALNAGATIEHAIKSVKKIVDKIIVVCGAVEDYAKVNPDMISKDQHLNIKNCGSIDDTVKIIDDLINDSNFKCDIRLVVVNSLFKNKTELQNVLFENMPQDTDIFFKQDADELFETSELLEAIKLFEDESVQVVGMKYYHYWKSLYRHVIGNEWDAPTCKLYRYNPNIHYSKSTMIPDGFNTIFDNSKMRYLNEVGENYKLSDCRIHHLGYVLHDDKFIQAKINYYKNRGIEKEVIDGYTNWTPGQPVIIKTDSIGQAVPFPVGIKYPDEIIKLRNKYPETSFFTEGEI